MRVIGYARVSTTNQDLERQKHNITSFCKSEGYELVELITDFGISGASNEREGYKKLCALNSSSCDMIVVSELSRLSRQDEITATLSDIQSVLSKGISITLLDNKTVYAGGSVLPLQDLIILVVGLWGAAQERKDIKKKMLDGKIALFLANPYAAIDGRVPYGYNKVPNPNSSRPRYILEENPEEVAHIKKLFELILSGYTLHKAVKYFVDRNIRFRKLFPCEAAVCDIIHNELYKGIRRRERKAMVDSATSYAVNITPIIEPSQWDLANEKVASNNKFVSTGKVYRNPLKGILRCKCGRAMVVKNKKPDPNTTRLTYRCSCNEHKTSPRYCTSGIDEVSYNYTNSVIKALFLQRYTEIASFLKETSGRKVAELQEVQAGITGRISDVDVQVASLEKDMKAQASKLLKLTDDFLIAAVEEEVASIRERIAKVQKEKLDLQARLADLNREIAEIEAMPIEADKNWVNISDEELEQIYHKTLEKIEYYPISLMKGFYKIVYKGGAELTIAVSKVRSNPRAYILNDADVDYTTGDMTVRYVTYEMKEGYLAPQTVNNEAQVNILDKDLFYSELFEMACLELAVTTDYRQQSQTEVYEAARTDK